MGQNLGSKGPKVVIVHYFNLYGAIYFINQPFFGGLRILIHTNLWMGLRYVSTVNQSHIWRMSSKFPRLRPIANPSQRLETEAKSGQSQKKCGIPKNHVWVNMLDTLNGLHPIHQLQISQQMCRKRARCLSCFGSPKPEWPAGED